jgi:CelD/BcsL family acetyltransferase involved in cellulose biosynthesis
MKHLRGVLDEEVTTRVIEDEREWLAIQHEWDELCSASATASAPLEHAWLRGWWRVYRPALRSASLRVITVRRAARLLGAFPLYVHREPDLFGIRHLRIISTGEAEFEETCPDYLNILCLPGEEVLCAREAWRAIDRMAWDHLEFLNLADSTSLLRPEIVPSGAETLSLGSCPIADLAGGFEAYLQRLSSNGRQQARRLLREGDLAGVRFEIAGTNRVADVFGDLIRLHSERWALEGKPGVFAAPRFVEFHRNLAAHWLPAGRAVLARLSLGAEPVAVLYGFLTGQKFDFYQSGVRMDNTVPLRSPGNLSHLLLMKALIDRGVTAYDFLRGSSSYKKRLATRETHLAGIRMWRPTLRPAVYRSARLAGRTIGTGFRFLRSRVPPTGIRPLLL